MTCGMTRLPPNAAWTPQSSGTVVHSALTLVKNDADSAKTVRRTTLTSGIIGCDLKELSLSLPGYGARAGEPGLSDGVS